jgi:hypothetical protein
MGDAIFEFYSEKMDEFEFSDNESNFSSGYENTKRVNSPFYWNNPLLSSYSNTSPSSNNRDANDIYLDENVDHEKFSECFLMNKKFIEPLQQPSLNNVLFTFNRREEESSFVIRRNLDSTLDQEDSLSFTAEINIENILNDYEPFETDCFFKTEMIQEVSEVCTKPSPNTQIISAGNCITNNHFISSFPSFNNIIIQNNIIQNNTPQKNEVFEIHKKINSVKVFHI